jgi:Sec-independent protein secretion pathway component TatC
VLKYFIEIKNRLFLLLLNCLNTAIVVYSYKETLLFLATHPSGFLISTSCFDTFYFIFTDATEIFSVYIKLITFLCVQISSNFFFYHIFIFFSFALYRKEYLFLKRLYKIFFFSWVLSFFITSNLLIPLTWLFFLSFQDLIVLNNSVQIHFEAKIIEYFNFYTYFYYVCVFYLQSISIFFFMLNHINSSLRNIKKFRKFYYLCFVFFSTLISPDVLVQLLLSLFFVLKYEFFVLFFIFKHKLEQRY